MKNHDHGSRKLVLCYEELLRGLLTRTLHEEDVLLLRGKLEQIDSLEREK